MTCREYQEWLSANLDGELEAAEAAELTLHLESCEACRKVQENYRVNRLLLHAMTPRRAPKESWMKLVGQIETAPPADNVVALEQAPSKRKARGSSWVAGLKAAACLAVVFLSTLFYLGYTDPELSAIPQPATQNVHRVSVGSLIRGHALLQTSNPFADHSAWQYVASESDLATAPRAPESESANSVDMMVQEDIR